MAQKRGGKRAPAKSSTRKVSASKSRSVKASRISAKSKTSAGRSSSSKSAKAAPARVPTFKKNLRVVLNNLVLFILLFLVSLILYQVLGQGIFRNLFSVFTILFGFVSVAFLLALLVFVFLRILKKR